MRPLPKGSATTGPRPAIRAGRLVAGALLAAALAIVAFILGRSDEDEAWARIQQRGAITFVTDPTYPPFEALDGDGEFYGFDIDLARALAERLGVRAEFEAASYDGLIGTLVTGRDDAVVSAYLIQPERGREASFTRPYFNAGLVVITRVEASVPGDARRWAAGKTLAAEYGTEGDALIRRWSRLVAGVTPIAAPDADGALRAVEDGPADGALADSVTAFSLLQNRPRLKIAAWIAEASAPYAIAVSADSRDLLRALNRALEAMEADGSLGALRAKWFGEAARVMP